MEISSLRRLARLALLQVAPLARLMAVVVVVAVLVARPAVVRAAAQGDTAEKAVTAALRQRLPAKQEPEVAGVAADKQAPSTARVAVVAVWVCMAKGIVASVVAAPKADILALAASAGVAAP